MRLLMIAIALFSVQAIANDVSLLCKRTSKNSCTERVVKTFDKLGCDPVAETVECEDAATSPTVDPAYASKLKGKDLCRVQSNCDEPTYDLVGRVSCRQGELVSLASVDKGLSLTVTTGLFRNYVKSICR